MDVEKEVWLLGWIARYDFVRGAFASARSHQEAVLEARRRLLGDEHPDTLTARSNLAQMLKAQGDLPGARSHGEAVLAAMRPLLGDEHPNAHRATPPDRDSSGTRNRLPPNVSD